MFKSTLNQAYLGTAIILLLLVLLASNPCKKLKYKALHDSDIDKKTIRIQTKDDIIFMDPNSVDIYLKRIKFNLLKLSNIKLDRNRHNIQVNIDISYINNVNNDISQFISYNKELDSNYTTEQELIQQSVIKSTELEYGTGTDEIQPIYELLSNIDIIRNLIKTKSRINGVLNLYKLDQVVYLMYQNNKKNQHHNYKGEYHLNNNISTNDIKHKENSTSPCIRKFENSHHHTDRTYTADVVQFS